MVKRLSQRSDRRSRLLRRSQEAGPSRRADSPPPILRPTARRELIIVLERVHDREIEGGVRVLTTATEVAGGERNEVRESESSSSQGGSVNANEGRVTRRRRRRRGTRFVPSLRRSQGGRGNDGGAATAAAIGTQPSVSRRELVVRIVPIRVSSASQRPVGDGMVRVGGEPSLLPHVDVAEDNDDDDDDEVPERQEEREPERRRRQLPDVVDDPVPVVPPVAEDNVVAVVVDPPRRRHAAVPTRNTYRLGITISVEDLEALCGAPHSCGVLNDTCRFCNALFFTEEFKNRAGIRQVCCKAGKVSLPPLRCPDEFRALFTERSPRTNEFLNNVRSTNSLFAMASFKTSAPNVRVQGQGRWGFTICGQVYHYTVGVPDDRDLREPVLSHFYFVDAAEVLERRNDMLGDRVRRETLELIETVLRRENRWVRAFKSMGEVLEEERVRRGGEEAVRNIVIGFSRRGEINTLLRQHALPQSRNEIAAVFYGDEPPFDVDLCLYPREGADDPAAAIDHGPRRDGGVAVGGGQRRHELKNLHPMADPMVYPLLFPCGEEGWAIGMRHNGHVVTHREFYRFRLQVREGEFSLLHNGGKLFQQYVVDAWVRVEANNLWWIRTHQGRFRHVQQRALRRALLEHPNLRGRVGRAYVLPTGFQGGPRFMQRLYLDAMTVVARHGKPDLFITFTCNPAWPEIVGNLQYNQRAEHRPDLVCRVFHTKWLEFVDDVVHKQKFGKVRNYHYVIEFQKRGLPHAHMVVTFLDDDKIREVEDVDAIIAAYFPDRTTQPRLYELVMQHQIHRPCGPIANPAAACMQEGRCSKGYPKSFREETALGAGGSARGPAYKRPDDGRHGFVGDFRVTNQRVVPYNAYALAKFQCHINFEVVGSLSSMKYLYKYVSKGSDYATIVEEDEGAVERVVNIDEIGSYLDCRYVSSMEAAWRLMEFKMYDRSHSVNVLPVHLPGGNYLVVDDYEDAEVIEDQLEATRSKLEAWFDLNGNDAEARELKYVQIPEFYVWEKREGGAWRKRRQIAKMLGSIAEVSARADDVELFYLRVLLSHVRGATSYEDLRTVNGVLCDTFREACVRANLILNLDEYDRCLGEAVVTQHPMRLRRLFATIISVVDGDRLDGIAQLWRRYRLRLIEDYLRRGVTRERAFQMCIDFLNEFLERNRAQVTCEILGIRVDGGDDDDDGGVVEGDDNIVAFDDVDVDGVDDGVQRDIYDHRSLNDEQKRIFLRIVLAVGESCGRALPDDFIDEIDADLMNEVVNGRRRGETLFYVDGPGGTGKTYLYNVIISFLSSVWNVGAVAVAWTGIAAHLLIGGTTAHRAFRLPLTLEPRSRAGYVLEHCRSRALREVPIVIWDEAPMSHRYAVEAVDRYFRELMQCNNMPFGGKCAVFGGDFRQVLPVIVRGHATNVIDASLKASAIWEDFTTLRLRHNMRVMRDGGGLAVYEDLGDRSFGDWLLALGEGRLPYVSVRSSSHAPNDLVEIPRRFTCESVEALLRFVYEEDFVGERVGERAILCPTNAAVETVNAHVLERLVGESRTYVSVDRLKDDGGEEEGEDDYRIPVDVLNSVEVAGLPPHELTLKVGAVVMLLTNLDVESGQCNGVRMRVMLLGEHLIQCELLTGSRRGRVVLLPRISMIARDTMLPKEMIRVQFPVRLAYAMTINKAQGQTLSRVGVYLKRPCFAHGQMYVAFSRVRNAEDVRMFVENCSVQGTFAFRTGRTFTRNVVYHSMLREDGEAIRRPLPQRMIIDVGDDDDDVPDEIFENIDEEGRLLVGEDPADAVLVGRGTEEDEILSFFTPHGHRAPLPTRISVGDRPGTSGLGRPPPGGREGTSSRVVHSDSSSP